MKKYFQDNYEALLWLANTRAGKQLIGAEPDDNIVRLSPNSFHKLESITNGKATLTGVFKTTNNVARELLPILTKSQIAQLPVRDEAWVEHASGLNFNSKYPSIYLLDYSSQPTDETGGKDSKIYGDGVTANHGTATTIDVIMTETNFPRRGLVEFDLSSITANSTVSAATFSLWTDTGYSNLSTAIHRLTAEWTESEVTWENRKTGTAWSSAGGDFDGSADATATPSSTSAGTKTDWNVASLVQEWVNGTANYGMLIKLVSESGSGSNKGHRFRSSATTTNNTEPKLVATYEEPVVTGGAIFFGTNF